MSTLSITAKTGASKDAPAHAVSSDPYSYNRKRKPDQEMQAKRLTEGRALEKEQKKYYRYECKEIGCLYGCNDLFHVRIHNDAHQYQINRTMQKTMFQETRVERLQE